MLFRSPTAPIANGAAAATIAGVAVGAGALAMVVVVAPVEGDETLGKEITGALTAGVVGVVPALEEVTQDGFEIVGMSGNRGILLYAVIIEFMPSIAMETEVFTTLTIPEIIVITPPAILPTNSNAAPKPLINTVTTKSFTKLYKVLREIGRAHV